MKFIYIYITSILNFIHNHVLQGIRNVVTVLYIILCPYHILQGIRSVVTAFALA